ncbi:MAG: IscS subfamily cysteine desulfurase [Alphaproteobacteria bacterium]|nr:IscS subfamily cysteine desulfurase [Rickettsiales bacterium]
MIYMDYQATTPIDKRVLKVVTNVLVNDFGNPSSISHVYGWRAKAIVESAREEVASMINSKAKEIIFTSGATEANNLAIKGVCSFYKSENKNHIVTSAIEHKCVIQVCRYLEDNGYDVTYLQPKQNGTIDPDDVKRAINDRTIMVSIFGIHNEIGTITDLKAIGKITKEKGVLFHTDLAQAFGKIKIDVDSMGIDLASISGHKIYGPKGIGAMYVRSKPKVRLSPLFHGGGQERGLRSGTLPTHLIAGLGEAARIAREDFNKDAERINRLGEMFCTAIMDIPFVYLNGDKKNRHQGNWNFSFGFVEGESLMMSIKNIAVSSSSACASTTLEPSYVLKSLNIPQELAHSAIRFGIGRQTTESEIKTAIHGIKKGVKKLRDMSPLWEMHETGIDISKIEWTK